MDPWALRATRVSLVLTDFQASRVISDLRVCRVLLVLQAHGAMKDHKDPRVRSVCLVTQARWDHQEKRDTVGLPGFQVTQDEPVRRARPAGSADVDAWAARDQGALSVTQARWVSQAQSVCQASEVSLGPLDRLAFQESQVWPAHQDLRGITVFKDHRAHGATQDQRDQMVFQDQTACQVSPVLVVNQVLTAKWDQLVYLA